MHESERESCKRNLKKAEASKTMFLKKHKSLQIYRIVCAGLFCHKF